MSISPQRMHKKVDVGRCEHQSRVTRISSKAIPLAAATVVLSPGRLRVSMCNLVMVTMTKDE